MHNINPTAAADGRSEVLSSPRIAAILILVFAIAVRWFGIGSQPLWLDEGYSWWDAQQSFANLWQLVPQCDPHPPFYASLLKLWVDVFGDSSTAMRSLSALAGVLATGFVMLAGREISTRVGLFAGLVFASMPFQIEFAHEARPYALVALGSAILCFGVLRVVNAARQGPDGTQRSLRAPYALAGWAALIGGLELMLWLNNTSVLTGAALGLVGLVLFVRDPGMRRLLKPMLASAAIVALLWLPYVPTYLAQANGVSADFWIPKPDLWRLGNELRFVVGLGSFQILWVLGAIWAAGLAVLVWRGAWRQALILGTLVVVPVLLNFEISRMVTPVFIARALIGIAAPFAIALAVACAALPARTAMATALAALVGAQIYTALPLYTAEHRKEPWDEIAKQLQEDARLPGSRPADSAVVLLTPNELALPLSHALEGAGPALTMHGVPGDFPLPGIHARYPSGKCAPSVVDQDLSFIKQAISGHKIVMFITRSHNSYDPNDRIPAFLSSLGLKPIRLREFNPGALIVHEYGLKP